MQAADTLVGRPEPSFLHQLTLGGLLKQVSSGVERMDPLWMEGGWNTKEVALIWRSSEKLGGHMQHPVSQNAYRKALRHTSNLTDFFICGFLHPQGFREWNFCGRQGSNGIPLHSTPLVAEMQ